MRTPLVVANWKRHKTGHEALAFVREREPQIREVRVVEIAVAPSFTALPIAADAATHTRIVIAAQDVHAEREGAFTGAVSVAMIKDAGATAVIIGHSERRRLFGDTDQTVNRKVHAAIAGDITPIVCIGETLEERERGGTNAILD